MGPGGPPGGYPSMSPGGLSPSPGYPGKGPGNGGPCGGPRGGEPPGLPPGRSFGVLGLELGVPGLSLSFCFRLGVDLELLLRLLGGLPSPRALSPLPLACSPPFTIERGPSSSPPTSTTRSPSDLSPESDSCPDFRRSSVFRRFADISSFGVDERMGLRAEIGDRGRWFMSLGPSRGSLLWRA